MTSDEPDLCDPRTATAHLTPQHWSAANRRLVAKAIAEFSHERILAPIPDGTGGYLLRSDDGAVEYRFRATVFALNHWRIDPAGITRRRGTERVEPDALELILEFRARLGVADAVLPTYLEEISSTLAGVAYRLAAGPACADELAAADFQTIEAGMIEGHPCFVANSGRLGFDAAEYLRYAPEAARGVRLVWVAADSRFSVFSCSDELDYAALVSAELGPETLTRFRSTMDDLGLDLDDYHLIPVHPWQWFHRLAVTFAADVARRRLVCLGYGADDYRAQQSIRTFFNTTSPSKHYVKTALSVLNMGFIRGLSADYMSATPAINDWVRSLVESDPVLASTGLRVLAERAAVGYRSEHYETASAQGSPYRKMLAALWRESPIPTLGTGERPATMASLLHVDSEGKSLVGALIRRSGLRSADWLRRYLDAYLVPLLHCFYAHQLVFMPHGENVILVLDGHVPTRVLIKDIGEEIAVLNADAELPAGVRRVRVEVPEELKTLSLFTDVFDSFLRFLAAILAADALVDEETFWSTVAACVTDYQRSAPELAERFARYDLFAAEFPLSCLNRLQLRDNHQMVDLQDPTESQRFAGTLPNPIAPHAPSR